MSVIRLNEYRKFLDREKNEHAKMMRDKMSEAYEKNQKEIDEQVESIVCDLVEVSGRKEHNLKKLLTNVMGSLFYKRPSHSVVDFLNGLGSYPSEVVLRALDDYSAFLITEGKTSKKNSLKYFNGYLRKGMFDFTKSQRKLKKPDLSESFDDDF